MKTVWLGVAFAILARSRGQTAWLRSVYQTGGTAVDLAGVSQTFVVAPGEHRQTWLLLPPSAPNWAYDRRRLWEEAARVERQWNGQEARRLDVQLPRDIPEELVGDVVRSIYGGFAENNLAVQVDYHVDAADDGGPNPHLHAIISTRSIGSAGFARSKVGDRVWNQFFRARGGRALREFVAEKLNGVLTANGIDVRVDPRPNRERGLPAAEWRLPRWMHRRTESEQARSQLDAIKAHRALRVEWEAAQAIERRASAEVARLNAEFEEVRRRRVSLRASSRRSERIDLADLDAFAVFEEFVGGRPVRTQAIADDMIVVNVGSASITVENEWLSIDGDCSDEALYALAELKHQIGWSDFEVVGTQGGFDAPSIHRLIRRATRTLDPMEFWLSVYESDPDVAAAVGNRRNIPFAASTAKVVEVIESAEIDAAQALRQSGVTVWELFVAIQNLQFGAIACRLAHNKVGTGASHEHRADLPAPENP
jgi:hypothetical protein